MALAQKDYIHKTVTLKCCIASSEIKKDTSHVRLISSNDWDKNLTLILSKIATKFKFIASMDDSKWILTINDKVIDKTNAVKFGELLSSVPPIAIIKIEEEKFIIIIHCNDKTFEYKLKSNVNEWTNDNYIDLIASIRKQFNINSDFDLFEHLKGDNDDIVDIDDMDDIKDAIAGLDTYSNGENDDSKESLGLLSSVQPLHLYVKDASYHAYDDDINEFKDIINELKTEINTIKQQLNYVKQTQKQYAHSDNNNNANKNEDNKQQEIFIGKCNKCNENIKYSENESFNIKLINNKWQHIDCGYTPKCLSLNKIDVWSKIKYSMIQSNERKASIDMATPAGWHNIFGLNTIKCGDGIIKWTIRINKLANSNFFIGIINSTKVRQSLTGNAYQNGIALNGNGYIYCFKEYYSTMFKCNQGDIVCIILDIENNILLFQVNDIDINVPVNDLNVNLKSINWKLFASLYNPGDEILILDNDNISYDDSKDENKEYELSSLRCSNCNKPVTKRDNVIYNIQWSNKYQWQHADCQLSVYQIPKLDALSAKDKFNKLSAYKAMVTLNDAADGFTTNKQNVYQTVFGVITLSKGVKEWNIRIDNGSSNIYIGIIETSKQNSVAPNSIPTANHGAYRMDCNGTIVGNGVNLQSNLSFTKNDVVSVVLDLDNNTLGFGKKSKFVIANGAQLANKTYNLFVSAYAVNNGVSIVDINANEEQKSNIDDKGKMLYNCGSCNKGIYELDFEVNNTKYYADGWVHVDCTFRIPNLSPNSRDEWDRRTSHNGRFIITRYDATSTGSGGYNNVFGIITITKNTKQWNVKVEKQQSTIYIGIIDSTKLQGKKTGTPSDSYYLTNGGCIQGSGLSINTGFGFKTGDVVNVILDMEKGVLSFGINNANFSYAKDAMIKGRSFNLFCCIYHYADQKVTIQP